MRVRYIAIPQLRAALPEPSSSTSRRLLPRADAIKPARARQPIDTFATNLLTWFDQHGRHDLPWQHPRTPYRVWLSEIMLQQTQVRVVIGYFERFVQAFPTLPDLAAASLDEVMAQWAGLGYYARARHLHAAARRCVELHHGELPRDFDALHALPGIGRSTAGAILSQAWNARVAIMDGNVKRVLSRVHGIAGWPGPPAPPPPATPLSEPAGRATLGRFDVAHGRLLSGLAHHRSDRQRQDPGRDQHHALAGFDALPVVGWRLRG